MTEPTEPETTESPRLGKFGIWRHSTGLPPELGSAVEELGYGTIWVGGSPPADLEVVERLLDATGTITVATGIVNIWSAPAKDVADSYHRIEARHPGRFLLGIGVGHPEATEAYTKPYEALVRYLDALDQAGVPVHRRALAALGPRVLELAATRSAGAAPYLTTPEHTRTARNLIGPTALLAPEQKVVLDIDTARARAIGREAVDNPYLHLRNYVRNLERIGFDRDELRNGGSDRVIDALVAHGDADRIAERLAEHFAAGADHVGIQALPASDDPLPTLRALAATLQLSTRP